ncbi:MAG: Gfo/Idh/MocA family oxidoreductase [Kiritimatiellae bacterium]|nr:Gfo/Idh/MocA family oxidoreductase [Kiritimatiellia bacterium]
MPKTYRVGILGLCHMHINHVAKTFVEHPRTDVVACADTVPLVPEKRKALFTREWNREHMLNELGIPKSYDDYREMLAHERLDIVACCSENVYHPQIVEDCAAAGVHVCVEKPMAMSMPHALRMARAAREAGILMMIHWPLSFVANLSKVEALIQAGHIGKPLEFRLRIGHAGPLAPGASHPGIRDKGEDLTESERAATWWHQDATGGGALLDFGCYGAFAAPWILGEKAQAVFGVKANLGSPWAEADDNGVMFVRFPGAMAILQGTWSTWHHGVGPGPIVYGERGTLVVEPGTNGASQVRLGRAGGGSEIFACGPLPDDRKDTAHEFITRLETGEPLHPVLGTPHNLEAAAILDAAVRSAANGGMEPVASATWARGRGVLCM